jgi:hypothetical protein
MDTEQKIKEKFKAINILFQEIINHNARIIYGTIVFVENCCNDNQLQFLYDLYNGFIETTKTTRTEPITEEYKIALVAAILFMYYNMVLIETHDNELLSHRTIAKNNRGENYLRFITVERMFKTNENFTMLNSDELNRLFEFFCNNISTNDTEVAFTNIRRFFLGPTFSARRNLRSSIKKGGKKKKRKSIKKNRNKSKKRL